MIAIKQFYIWDDESVKLLKWYVSEGMSGSQIAKAMDISRNSVIGKVSRLGLKLGRNLSDLPVGDGPKLYRRRITIHREPIPSSDPGPIVDNGAHLTTLTIGRNQCRYPHGDVGSPHFHFCGQKTAPGKSWCSYHYGRVFHREKVKTADEREQINRAVAAQRKWAA